MLQTIVKPIEFLEVKNVVEIDNWDAAQFHQRPTYSFYARSSQKRKKYS